MRKRTTRTDVRQYLVTARVAKAMGRLYVSTNGRGPRWREAVASLSRVLYGAA